jgi:hypothetical protein
MVKKRDLKTKKKPNNNYFENHKNYFLNSFKLKSNFYKAFSLDFIFYLFCFFMFYLFIQLIIIPNAILMEETTEILSYINTNPDDIDVDKMEKIMKDIDTFKIHLLLILIGFFVGFIILKSLKWYSLTYGKEYLKYLLFYILLSLILLVIFLILFFVIGILLIGLFFFLHLFFNFDIDFEFLTGLITLIVILVYFYFAFIFKLNLKPNHFLKSLKKSLTNSFKKIHYLLPIYLLFIGLLFIYIIIFTPISYAILSINYYLRIISILLIIGIFIFIVTWIKNYFNIIIKNEE